jgi:dienelactone hydrolase
VPTKDPAVDAPADTSHGPYPLVLMSHGYTALGSIYQAIGSQWASAGYVVAAPDYPLSNNKAPGGPVVTDTNQQPADASFVIDQVIAQDKTLTGGIVDAKHIGAAGHSLGAITTYGLAYSDCCRDKRIDAAITMAGATILVDAPAHYFHGTTTPLLAIHGDADKTLPISLEQSAYARATKPKLFVTFGGGNHIWPYLGGDDARANSFYDFTTAFFDRYLKLDAGALTRLRQAVATPGANATLRENNG